MFHVTWANLENYARGYHDNVAFLFDFAIKEFLPVGVQGPSDRKKGLTTLFLVLILQRIIGLL